VSTSAIIGVVFDFDDTLIPDSTTKLLENNGIDPKKFWLEDTKKLVTEGYDPTLAYLKLILDNIGKDKPLGHLTNDALRCFGKTLDSLYYPGIPQIFDDLKAKVEQSSKDIKVEFYVISGGLQEIMEGSEIIKKYFDGVYGCKLESDTPGGELKYIKRCINFTEKTRYLFEINKGIEPEKTKKNPYLVNRDVPTSDRRIPIQNMIYIGDGLTDIPCFSLVKGGTYRENKGGAAFGVFHPGEEKSARRAFLDLLKSGRTMGTYEPNYTPESALGSIIRAAVVARCADIQVERGQVDAEL